MSVEKIQYLSKWRFYEIKRPIHSEIIRCNVFREKGKLKHAGKIITERLTTRKIGQVNDV